MNLTPLPTRADKHRTEGLHEAAVRVGDDQLDAAEAAIAEGHYRLWLTQTLQQNLPVQ